MALVVVYVLPPFLHLVVHKGTQINIPKNYKMCKASGSDAKCWGIKYYSRKVTIFLPHFLKHIEGIWNFFQK